MIDLMRRQLDKQIDQLRPFVTLTRPSKGWVRAIREALGMNRSQLGQRMDITPQAIEQIEKSEEAHTVSLKTLQQTAESLNCKVFYILIPEKLLEEMVDLQIQKKAREIVENISHSMRLEEQATSTEEAKIQIMKVIEDIKRRKNIAMIWDENK